MGPLRRLRAHAGKERLLKRTLVINILFLFIAQAVRVRLQGLVKFLRRLGSLVGKIRQSFLEIESSKSECGECMTEHSLYCHDYDLLLIDYHYGEPIQLPKGVFPVFAGYSPNGKEEYRRHL